MKQAVFLAYTGASGDGEAYSPPKLNGTVKRIDYITDNRVPFADGVSFIFSGKDSKREVLTTDAVSGRQSWEPGTSLENEQIKVAIVGGGQGKSGSFVVTME